MKSIKMSDYNKGMGVLICLDDEVLVNGAINMSYEKLLYNKDKLLNKNNKYYIYCKGGYKSRNAVNLLNLYGYDVTQVLLK